jgi:putrescine aminotransferase
MTGAVHAVPSVHPAFGAIRRHLPPPLALAQRMVGLGAVEDSAAGAVVTLSDGRQLLDFGSYAVTLAGHGHPSIVAAVREQLDRQPTATRSLANPVAANFAERLVAAVGAPGLTRVWLGLNGADAVEAALKLARVSTGRQRILAVDGGFHGKSLGALAVTSSDRYRAPVRELLGGVTHLDPADTGAVARECAAGDVAGLIFEPVQGENGVVPLDTGLLRRWAEDARAVGAVVIADEIQTGMGRCGPLSVAVEDGIPVDALLLGKSLGGGVMPLSAAVCTDPVYRPFATDPFLHTTTFSGHPLSCAAGTAMLDVVAGLRPQAADLSARVERMLAGLRRRHQGVITGVRGRGLLWGLSFGSAALAGDVLVTVSQRGLLLSPCLGHPEILRLLPPLITTTEQLTMAGGLLDETCAELGPKYPPGNRETT